MRNYFICIIFIVCSCNNKKSIVLYEHNGICITRIDEGVVSKFYFGKFDINDSLPSHYVESSFSGLNSGMDAYLIFKPNHVELFVIMADFKTRGGIENIKIIDNWVNYNIHDKYSGNYLNVFRLSDHLPTEQKINADNKSNIQATYW
ncbi:MAG: hypothetical protein Q8K70_10005 [Bacteroidota bacterium]|nr:hypothetical protein [Bacteroidota bacterium]